MAKKKKYYVVWVGVSPGVYDSWDACQQQIKAYPGAKYKSFVSKAEAESAYRDSYEAHYQKSGKTKSKSSGASATKAGVVWESISVDAACSGNPGVTEYQGVHTRGGEQIFHQKFELGTNNIGEFLAIVHALALLKTSNPKLPIYTDSRTALAWIRNRKVKTNLVRNAKTKRIHELIVRAENWLKNNTYENPLLKWDTERWGEIPADFGRK